jgi:hypothetical protein
MPDLSSLTAALNALGALMGLASKTNNLEFNRHLIELQGKLLTIQQDMLGLQEENRSLRAKLEAATSFTFHHSVLWRNLDDGESDGPFCPVCHAKDITIRLRFRRRADSSLLSFECPNFHSIVPGSNQPLLFLLPKDLIPENRYLIRS